MSEIERTNDVVLLAVNSLHANDYNPNEMSESEFAELVAEVRHLGRPPKPIIVRRNASGYVIVDGEHGWRAAKQTGLETIPCEVADIDDFEAMRQTYKRNQHGAHNPVRLGQMFAAMMQTESLSRRALADKIDVSEGTIRNALLYSQAAALRNDYAFEKLTVKQIRVYLALPQSIGDRWLDAGGDHKLLTRAFAASRVGGKKIDPDLEWFAQLEMRGLHVTIEGSRDSFVSSVVRAFQFWDQLSGGDNDPLGFDAYILETARSLAPYAALDLLPAAYRDNEPYIPITLEQWGAILIAALEKGLDEEDQLAMIKASASLALHRAGVVAADLTDPRTIQKQRIIDAAPDFIRNADLAFFDKHELAAATSATVQDDVLLEAKRQTVEILLTRNSLLADPEFAADGLREMLSFTVREKLNDVLLARQRDAEIERQVHERESLLSSRDNLQTAISAKLNELALMREGRIGERASVEVMIERLAALPFPEFQFIGALLTGHGDVAPAYWLKSIRKELDLPDASLSDDEQIRFEHLQQVIKEGLEAGV